LLHSGQRNGDTIAGQIGFEARTRESSLGKHLILDELSGCPKSDFAERAVCNIDIAGG
jgi:hypothetical protein